MNGESRIGNAVAYHRKGAKETRGRKENLSVSIMSTKSILSIAKSGTGTGTGLFQRWNRDHEGADFLKTERA